MSVCNIFPSKRVQPFFIINATLSSLVISNFAGTEIPLLWDFMCAARQYFHTYFLPSGGEEGQRIRILVQGFLLDTFSAIETLKE